MIFLKITTSFYFFVNGLDNDLSRAKIITAKLHAIFFVFKFIGIALDLIDLTEEQCFMKDDILGIMQKSYNEIQQINNVMAKILKIDLAEKFLNVAQHFYNGIKEQLNECQ